MYNKTQSDYIKNAPGACWCWQVAHVEENNAPMCNEFMRSKIDIVQFRTLLSFIA